MNQTTDSTNCGVQTVHTAPLDENRTLHVHKTEGGNWLVFTTYHDRPESSVTRLVMFPDGGCKGYGGECDNVEEFYVNVVALGGELAELMMAAPEVNKAPNPNSEPEPHRMLWLSGTPAQNIAREFVEILEGWLDSEKMEQIALRNFAENNRNICHTHDFCDPNAAMLEACARIVPGFDFDGNDEAQTVLINEAWRIAKLSIAEEYVPDEGERMTHFNIQPALQKAAHLRGLGMIGTGGGCDYVYRKLDTGEELVVIANDDSGSPCLHEACNVCLFKDAEWTLFESRDFPNASLALDYMRDLKSAQDFEPSAPKLPDRTEAISHSPSLTIAAPVPGPTTLERAMRTEGVDAWHIAALPDKSVEIHDGTGCPVAVVCYYPFIDERMARHARLMAAAPAILFALQRLQANPNNPRAHRLALDAMATLIPHG